MKHAIAILLFLCAGITGIGQYTLTAVMKDAATKEPLAGASILNAKANCIDARSTRNRPILRPKAM